MNLYKRKNKLKAEFIGRGGSWLDTGSINDFNDASNYISTIENRQGLKIACIEEIALKINGYQKKRCLDQLVFMGIVNTQNI